MTDNTQQASNAPSQKPGRPIWTAPVVSFLPIDQTAINASTGNDGRGTTTGS